MKAMWKGAILAESNETVEVEGNAYFPPNSLNKEFFKESSEKSTCPWKGEAHYYNLEVAGDTNKAAAWYYPNTKPLANKIKGYVAFWKDVEVSD
jgi:uncharacterized protein (DUF427 family)